MDEALEIVVPGKPLAQTAHQQSEKAILARVREICGWGRQTFPGSQPVSLSSTNMNQLGTFPYVACEKTDGVRYLLLASSRMVFLIDRKETIQVLDMTLPLPGMPENENGDLLCHQSTLLDGELVRDQMADGSTRVSFLVYDAVSINKDMTVCRRNLLERLKRVLLEVIRPRQELEQERTDILDAEKKNKSYLPIYLKDFFEIWDIIAIKSASVRLPHLSDGIIFTPVAIPYVPGTCRQLMKWKPPELNTLDFASELLYARHGPNDEVVPVGAKLLIGSRGFRVDSGCWIVQGQGAWASMLARHKQYGDCDGAIWECYFDPKATTIIPTICGDYTLTQARIENWQAVVKRYAAKTGYDGGSDASKKLRRSLNDIDDADTLLVDENLCKTHAYPLDACPVASVGSGTGQAALYDYNECMTAEGGWVLERIRTDKTSPNDERVMVKIKESIDSGISFEALFEHIISMKHAIQPCYDSCEMPGYYEQYGCRLRQHLAAMPEKQEQEVWEKSVPADAPVAVQTPMIAAPAATAMMPKKVAEPPAASERKNSDDSSSSSSFDNEILHSISSDSDA